MGEQRVVVVGGGAGGLTAALLLVSRGVAVTVLDAASGPGGKLRQVQVEGADARRRPYRLHHALGVRRTVR